MGTDQPPKSLDGAKVILYCSLKTSVRLTGKYRLFFGGRQIQPLNAAICHYPQYPHDAKYYIFYCDENWEVIGDMDYDSLEEARDRLEQEYAGAGALLRPPCDP